MDKKKIAAIITFILMASLGVLKQDSIKEGIKESVCQSQGQ